MALAVIFGNTIKLLSVARTLAFDVVLECCTPAIVADKVCDIVGPDQAQQHAFPPPVKVSTNWQYIY
jgi:hypothetical protein